MHTLSAICLLLSLQVTPQEAPLERIVFGSCFKTDGDPQVWSVIDGVAPDALVLLGDNVYADTEDMAIMRARYEALDALPDFRSLRSKAHLIATWDDHDYGEDDAGREYGMRAESQEVFLDFLGEPADSQRRRTPGVHGSRILGPEGRRVQFLVLDTRYFRDPLERRSNPGLRAFGRYGPYEPTADPSLTLLGEEQWQWLGEELKKPAEVRIVVSSIQFVADEHGWEKWGNFPHERERFLRLVRDTGAEGVLILSGDRHHAELSVMPPSEALPYPLYDITSSSLNRGSSFRNEVNRYRHGSKLHAENFGSLEIDWATEDPRITLRIHQASNGRAVIAHHVPLSSLRPSPSSRTR